MNSALRMLATAFLASSVLSDSPGSIAADWPQWRGPARTSISRETGLLRQWLAEGPKLLWQVNDLGSGYSTPSIVAGKLYLLSNQGMENEYVEARDAADGHSLWQTRIGNVGPNQGPQYPGSRTTPTVDGDTLFALGSDGDLACLETSTGKLRWQKNLRQEFGGKPGKWAYSESPLVDGNALICAPGGADATVVALDKQTGNVIWKSPLDEADEAAYASAVVAELCGVRQYVHFLSNGLVGLDTSTGKLLWRYSHTAKGSPANIPTPVVRGDFVYCAAGRTGGGLAHIVKQADGLAAEEVYFSSKLPMGIGGAVEIDGYLYGANSQGLMCVDFQTGELKWQDRSVGACSICAADGLLLVHGEKGDLALVTAQSSGYQELGRVTPPNQPERGRSSAWAYPVLANGRLYIRDLQALWCYQVGSP